MNPESFKAKILISLVDKFLIGLAASGLLLYFQYAQRQTERMDQERRAVGSVWTDEVADQRTKLATGVSDLLELVDRLAPTGRARDADAERLDDVVRDIGGSISMLRRVRSFVPEGNESTCHSGDDTVLDGFTALVADDLTLGLLAGRMEPQAVQRKLNEILAEYVNVLAFVRCLALDTLHYEGARVP